MPQIGTPEQYFGTPTSRIAITEPIEAKILEPVNFRYVNSELQTQDYTPLIIGVIGLVSVIGLIVLGLGLICLTRRGG